MAFKFFKQLLTRTESLRPTNGTPGRKRTILLVSSCSSDCDTVRVFALLYGWHLLVASDLRTAVELQRQEKATVILYDRDARGMVWSEAVGALLQATPSAGCLLLSSATDESLRLDVLLSGGYDVAPKPLTLGILAPLVNGYWTLLQQTDAVNRRNLHDGRNRRQAGATRGVQPGSMA